MHIVTVAEMRELEAEADRHYGLTSHILMSIAGRVAAEIFKEHLPPHQSIVGLEVLFLIGPGNNGGDGLVMAQHLQEAGALITLYYWKEHKMVMYGEAIAPEKVDMELDGAIMDADYIIDALLGTGTSRPLPDSMKDILQQVHMQRELRPALRVVAIDLPTGLNADTGAVDPGTIRADMTITLACPKQGFFFFPGRDFIGKLYVGDIGIPAELENHLHTEMLTSELVRTLVPDRPLNSNKGTFGKVLLFCGSPPYPGSAYLAGSAAGRVGAGLVTLAGTAQMLTIYASTFHEATFVFYPAEDGKSFERSQALIEHLHGYRSLLIGPGLGQSANTREVILQLLEYLRAQPENKRARLVIDADGLNNLSALEHWWTLLAKERQNKIHMLYEHEPVGSCSYSICILFCCNCSRLVNDIDGDLRL